MGLERLGSTLNIAWQVGTDIQGAEWIESTKGRLGCDTVGECSPGMLEALGWIPSTGEKNQ